MKIPQEVFPAYDNTYSIIHRDVKIPAATEAGGAADWVRSAVSWNLLPDSWLRASPGATVSGTVAASYSHKAQALDLTQQDLNKFTETLNQAPVDLHTALKQDPSLIASLEKFGPILNATGHNYTQAIGELAKVNPQYAGSVAALYGGGQALHAFDQKQALLDAQTKTYNVIDTAAKATAVLSNPGQFTPDQVQAARNFQRIDTQSAASKAGAEAQARSNAENAATPGNPALAGSNPVNGVNAAYLASLPAQQRAIVQAIGEGRQEGPNTRTKQGQALSELVNNAYPDYDGTRYHTYQAMQKDFVSGKTGQGLIALNTALTHLQSLYDNANLGSTLPGVSTVERIAGNQSAVNLRAAQVAVGDELGKAYKNGVLSEPEHKEWQSMLNGWTPANVKQNAVAFSHLLDGKIAAEQQLRNGGSLCAVKLPALMSPEAGTAYQHITGEVPTTSVGYRAPFGGSQTGNQSQPNSAPKSVQIPAGAQIGRDAKGNAVGYKLPNGQYVPLNGAQ